MKFWRAGMTFPSMWPPRRFCLVAAQRRGPARWRLEDHSRTKAALLAASDETWRKLTESDWMEAFNSHPRIGESSALHSSAERSTAWAMQEQKKVAEAGDAVKIALAEGNREYEDKFGRIFIVCAAGKSAADLLKILRRRLLNDPRTELYEAAEQQRQIIQIRLRKWLQG